MNTWRERTKNPVTRKIQQRVRGRNGKVLTNIELTEVLQKFIHTELVDKGQRLIFYENFRRLLVTPDSRARTQICLGDDFVQTHGDLSLLRNLWSRDSSFTNYRAILWDSVLSVPRGFGETGWVVPSFNCQCSISAFVFLLCVIGGFSWGVLW